MSKNHDQYSLDTGDVPPNIAKLRMRASSLSFADSQITEANKHLGAAVITENYAGDLGLSKTKNTRAYNERYNMANDNFLRACGRCAVEGCELRDNFSKWEDKYHLASKRHSQVARAQREAEQGVETPC